MRVAYADPPYIGMAKRHYTNDPSGIAPAEVNHAVLIERLEREYDGYALSCSAKSLPQIMVMLAPHWGKRHRVCAWCKPFAAYKTCNPSYSWEPVIVKQPRAANYPSVRDYVLTNMTLKTGTHGAKPRDFCFWLFDALNLVHNDELVDLYPGSGAVMESWFIWHRQAPATRCKKRPRPTKPQLWEVTAHEL